MKGTRALDSRVKQSGNVTACCELCGSQFTKYHKGHMPLPRFCNRSCAAKHLSSSGKNGFASASQLPPETRQKIAESRRLSTTRRNTGKRLSGETRKKISESCMGKSNPIKGKTYSEYYGEERATELAESHSRKLKEGFKAGRIKPTARTSSAPTYKGVKLRSMLEQSAIQLLESYGRRLGEDIFYEDERTRVEWVGHDGASHTYTPDIYDSVSGIVYEVKPAWLVRKPTREMVLKEESAIQQLRLRGMTFSYMTSDDILCGGLRHGQLHITGDATGVSYADETNKV